MPRVQVFLQHELGGFALQYDGPRFRCPLPTLNNVAQDDSFLFIDEAGPSPFGR